jgi:hypothetical protein
MIGWMMDGWMNDWWIDGLFVLCPSRHSVRTTFTLDLVCLQRVMGKTTNLCEATY